MTPRDKPKILAVDDIPNNLHLLVRILTKRGYEVIVAESDAAALAIIQQELPDLILLDIMMPDMNGYEVCRQLKVDEQTKDIPVIFLSRLNDIFDKLTAFFVGGVDYITKPFQAKEVRARVKTHLTIHKLQKQLQEKNAQLEEKNKQLQERNIQLQEALDNIKTLKEFIPICANCKKIRNDEGFWQQVEVYVRDHSEAEFSHGICPDCKLKFYPEFYSDAE